MEINRAEPARESTSDRVLVLRAEVINRLAHLPLTQPGCLRAVVERGVAGILDVPAAEQHPVGTVEAGRPRRLEA